MSASKVISPKIAVYSKYHHLLEDPEYDHSNCGDFPTI